MGLRGITIGQLDEKVEIQKRTKTGKNAANEDVFTTTSVATVPAKVMTRAGREGYEANQQVASTVQTFMIRWRNDVVPDMWLVWDGDDWFINSVEKIGRRSHLLINVVMKDNQ
jgi:SPP1 family predicted phage head-tail adaptor